MNLTCATIAAEFEMAWFIVFCLLLCYQVVQEDFATLLQVMIVHCGLHLMTTAAVSVEITWEVYTCSEMQQCIKGDVFTRMLLHLTPFMVFGISISFER